MREITEAELREEAQRLAGELAPARRARVVALYGELGAGKTTFVKAFAAALGVKENVASPTFVIEKVCPLAGQSFKHLIHIDAYRLESSEELVKLGWEEVLANPENLIVVEWADKVENILPENTHRITIAVSGAETRTIAYAS